MSLPSLLIGQSMKVLMLCDSEDRTVQGTVFFKILCPAKYIAV